ncbi:MAG: hypothetical protein MHM6MM_006576 [Cercozoa sp. M6MM]
MLPVHLAWVYAFRGVLNALAISRVFKTDEATSEISEPLTSHTSLYVRPAIRTMSALTHRDPFWQKSAAWHRRVAGHFDNHSTGKRPPSGSEKITLSLSSVMLDAEQLQ